MSMSNIWKSPIEDYLKPKSGWPPDVVCPGLFFQNGSNFSLNREKMPDKKVVGKKDCAEWVTKRIPFSGAFFSLFSAVTTNIFPKKSKTFIVQMGKVEKKVVVVA